MNRKLLGLVYTALENALEGGAYESVATINAYDEAINLLDYDADTADFAQQHDLGVMDVQDCVEAWIKSKESKK